MEVKRAAQQSGRLVAELRAGSHSTSARLAMSGGQQFERRVLTGSVNGAHAGALQNKSTGRRLFMLDIDSLASLDAGLVELG